MSGYNDKASQYAKKMQKQGWDEEKEEKMSGGFINKLRPKPKDEEEEKDPEPTLGDRIKAWWKKGERTW